MESTSNITGLVLAGGAGRRMGYRDKGLAEWRGKPLVAHVTACLRPQVETILISCNRNFSRYRDFSDGTVPDDRAGFQGPLAGLEAALPYIETDILVVVGCDMPRLPTDLVSRLIAPLAKDLQGSLAISYAHDGTRAQYLCAALRRGCLSSLASFLNEGHRAVRDWYAMQQTTEVDFSTNPEAFENYNWLE
jgi:molybdopterin-guanine dinucleotide biosynthesis protein A